MESRQTIAERLLGEVLGQGVTLENGVFAPCPGAAKHTKANGKKDFRVVLDGAPTGYCFHGSCSDDVAAFNKELRRRIWFAENGQNAAPRGHWGEGVAPAPKKDVAARPPLDKYAVWEFTRGVPAIDEAWCKRHSPVDVETVESRDFLNRIYLPGDRILIFTNYTSQGDFLWCVESDKETVSGGFRLADRRGVKAVSSALPKAAPEGVWYLVQPVTGKWDLKSDVQYDPETRERDVQGKWTRRSQGNVTAWRYFVLESDELQPEEWLKVLANLPVPIAAIYTSGGRSIHALVRYDTPSKAAWDAVRNSLRSLVCPLGADPAALTAVRLSRLPDCRRGERLQKLLYLNPNPDHREIRLLREVRA